MFGFFEYVRQGGTYVIFSFRFSLSHVFKPTPDRIKNVAKCIREKLLREFDFFLNAFLLHLSVLMSFSS